MVSFFQKRAAHMPCCEYSWPLPFTPSLPALRPQRPLQLREIPLCALVSLQGVSGCVNATSSIFCSSSSFLACIRRSEMGYSYNINLHSPNYNMCPFMLRPPPGHKKLWQFQNCKCFYTEFCCILACF